MSEMIVEERMTDFIHSLDPQPNEILEQIREEALNQYVPIIKDETAALLKTLVCLKNPEHILEVGCAVGYSALTMASVLREGGHITTIEKYEPRIPVARRNIELGGCKDRITLLEGDAEEILKRLQKEGRTFDFIFMDAAKAQYPIWLPTLLSMMPQGACLVSDNILQEGSLADSRFTIVKRDRTIHARVREYLYMLKHDPFLETAVLTVGDGVAVSVKK